MDNRTKAVKAARMIEAIEKVFIYSIYNQSPNKQDGKTMLSYKEYKLLNESLYGALNLGIKSQNTVGGIVSDSQVNGTEAAVEAESEEAIEEAKKMKKKMLGDEEAVEKVKVTDEKEEDEDKEDDSDEGDEDKDSDEDDSEDNEESEEDEKDSDEDEKDSEDKKDFSFMKKKMKKKSKKEWDEVMADLESLLEVVDDEEALTEVKKGLEMMKKGMEKGMEKKMGCGAKKCGKYMSESDAAWWKSVNGMLGTDLNQKGWDGGWTEVGEVQQGVREEN